MSDFQKYLDDNLGNIKIDNIEDDTISVAEYDIYKEIRERVISLRHECEMTQKDLAAKSGITQANISNLEKGRIKPNIDTLKKIADAMGMRLVVDFVGQEVE
jgi:DNA-binding XRE family transcriptional regulator